MAKWEEPLKLGWVRTHSRARKNRTAAFSLTLVKRL